MGKYRVMRCERHITVEADTEEEALKIAAEQFRSEPDEDALIAWWDDKEDEKV
jgi:hypothetical protein